MKHFWLTLGVTLTSCVFATLVGLTDIITNNEDTRKWFLASTVVANFIIVRSIPIDQKEKEEQENV